MNSSYPPGFVIELRPVTKDNWRSVYALQIALTQKKFVADPAYYLNLCQYGGLWHPLAAYRGGELIGFLMWALDDSDDSC